MSTTKVVLLDNVAKLGKKYDVKEVASGYARNFLLPNQKAVLATKSVIDNIDSLRSKAETERGEAWTQFLKEADKLKGVIIELTAKANEEGHLYGAVHPEDVAEKITADFGLVIDPEWLQMPTSVKATGDYDMAIGKDKDKVDLVLKISAEA